MGVTKATKNKPTSKKPSAAKAGVVLPVPATPAQLRRRWNKKTSQVEKLANNIQSLRYNLTTDMKSDDQKVFLTALCVKCMELTGERVGNDESAANGHRGITGLLKSQVKVEGNKVSFRYTGKSGVNQDKSVTDEKLADGIRRAKEISKAKYLFCTDDGFKIKNDRVNRYLADFEITAKDLRGFSANRWLIQKLVANDIADEEKDRKKDFNAFAKVVAAKVGHGTGMLKNQYLIPGLEKAYVEEGKIIDIKDIAGYKKGGGVEKMEKGGVVAKKESTKKPSPSEPAGKTIKYSEFKEDIQTFIFQFLEDSGAPDKILDNLYRARFVVKPYPIKNISPEVNEASLDKDRGVQHAAKFKKDKYQPVIFFNNKLIDGFHRAYSEKQKGASVLYGIELSDVLHEKKAELKAGGQVSKPDPFNEWFAGSKVVDSKGQPLIVYHGTDAENITTFNIDLVRDKFGFWFSDDKEFSEMFGTTAIPVYLCIKNPHVISKEKWDDIRRAHAKDAVWFASWRDQLISKGKDALIIESSDTTFAGTKIRNPEIYAVFHPTQIKLADGSNTTFDGNNPDIRFEKGGHIYRSVGMEGYLVGKSRCPYIGKEKEIDAYDTDIRCFVSETNDTYRFIYVVNKKNVSVLHIQKEGADWVIRNAFTLEHHRRHGYGRSLYLEAQKHLRRVVFSSNLSQEGKAFKENVTLEMHIGNNTEIGRIDDETDTQFQIKGTWYAKWIIKPAAVAEDNEGILVPDKIKPTMIISAFSNEMDWDKVERYADIMKESGMEHGFPAISGYPIIIDENEIGDQFLTGEEVSEHHVGQLAWKVTNGHHRSLGAIKAALPWIDVELDYSTVTNMERHKRTNGKYYESGGITEDDEPKSTLDQLKEDVSACRNFDIFRGRIALREPDEVNEIMTVLGLEKATTREIGDINLKKLKDFYTQEKRIVNERRKIRGNEAAAIRTEKNVENIFDLAKILGDDMDKAVLDYEEKKAAIKYPVQLITVEPSILDVLNGLSDKGCRALIVGGAVRDAILGITPKDIDIEVYNITYADLSEYLSQYGRVNLVGKNFGVIKFNPAAGGMEYDFSVPRRENKIGVGHKEFEVTFDTTMTIKDAAMRRDFTFNSLAYDPVSNTVYDYFNGLMDIRLKVIRHTSEKFTEDALRILRAMQFQARFDFTIAEDTNTLMREMLTTSDEFASLPKERVFEEWYKWASKGVRHDLIFSFMRDCGLIDCYPVLKALAETPQDAVYHPEGNVEVHTTLCLTYMDSILSRMPDIPADEKVVLVMSTLLHDVGKPATTEEQLKNGRMTITSNGHEALGGKMCHDFLPSLGFHKDLVDPIANIVANHLAGVNITMIPHESGRVKAVKKLSKRLYPATIQQLLHVMDADSNGRGWEEYKEPTGAKELTTIAADINVTDRPYEFILLGRHLIEAGLKPSPAFGEILRKANEAQLNGEFNDITGGRQWLKDNLDSFVNGGIISAPVDLFADSPGAPVVNSAVPDLFQ